jgi:hypothetical protein
VFEIEQFERPFGGPFWWLNQRRNTMSAKMILENAARLLRASYPGAADRCAGLIEAYAIKAGVSLAEAERRAVSLDIAMHA